MPFNIDKCQVVHLSQKNLKAIYYLQEANIIDCEVINDLGVSVNGNFKFGYHCGIASKKANRMLGFIKKTISCKSSDIILPLYRGLVRPHLEYAVQFWSPHLRKDIDLLERVQHKHGSYT